MALSQLAFYGLFRSGLNLRFVDPSLTEAQILVGLALHTALLAQRDSARGSLLMFYLLIVVFGGRPTVVEGRPLWAAIVGLVGVVVGVVLIGMAVNSMIRERRARNRAGR